MKLHVLLSDTGGDNVNREYIIYILENYFGRVIGILLGFFIALIIVVFGFWQGLLMIVLIGIGFYFGQFWDQERRIPFIDKFLPPWR